MTTTAIPYCTLLERHDDHQVAVELRFYPEDKRVTVHLTDPLGSEEVTLYPEENAIENYLHPYSMAFLGRNPWERKPETDDDEDGEFSVAVPDDTVAAI